MTAGTDPRPDEFGASPGSVREAIDKLPQRRLNIWSDSAIRQMRRHPQLAIGALITLAAVAQVYIVARGDADVIRTLLTYVDVPRVALELLVFWVPLLAAFAVPIAWLGWFGDREHAEDADSHGPPTLPVFLTVMALIVSPVWLLVLVGLYMLAPVGAAVVWPWYQRRRGKGAAPKQPGDPEDKQSSSAARDLPSFLGRVVGGVLLPVVISVLTLVEIDRPWVAREVLAVAEDPSGPPQTVDTGYVLGSSGQSLVVLWDSDRTVWVIPENEVVFRQPCSADAILGGASLWRIFASSVEPGLIGCYRVVAETTAANGPEATSSPAPPQ
jgi:hypothetical protein